MNINRDRRIDILRCLALLGIIVAHVNPSNLVMQLRSYDVPMMAFLSGVSYYLSIQGKEINYSQYLIKRFKKLIFPTWIFLTCFFIGTFLISVIRNESYYFSQQKIIDSYTFLGGIGFVWIVWIFFSIALINPFLLYLNNLIRNTYIFILLWGFAYIIYLGLVHIYKDIFIDTSLIFVEHYILYTLGYSLVATLGICFHRLKQIDIGVLAFIFLAIYLYMAFKKNFELTGNYKYPPTTYYLSYALALILIMYLLLNIKPLYTLLNKPVIWFISENSFWIYLWHIVPYYTIRLFGLQKYDFFQHATGRYIFVFGTSIILTLSHTIIQTKIRNHSKSKKGANFS